MYELVSRLRDRTDHYFLRVIMCLKFSNSFPENPTEVSSITNRGVHGEDFYIMIK